MKQHLFTRRAARWIIRGFFLLCALGVVGTVIGCADFAAGFRRQLAAELPSVIDETGIIDRIETKAGAGVGDAVRVGLDALAAKIPPPPAPAGYPLAERAGEFVALVAALFARDKLKERKERKGA